MARKLGPKIRFSRRMGEALFYNPKETKILTRRGTAPGQHGAANRRLSGYGLQLREKQKAKLIYGLLEKQFRKNYQEALNLTGDTGELLLQLLERRLDNVVYRSGLAITRAQARQLVNHGHFMVNQKRVDIPSYRVKIGDTVTVRPNKMKKNYFESVNKQFQSTQPPVWLKLDPEHWTITVLALPRRQDIEHNLKPQLIVEFYSR